MNDKRPIRDQETELISFLLSKANLNPENYAIMQQVCEYEGGIMGSIGLGSNDAVYIGDIIQAKYIDTDNVPVVITLTKDTENRLLDLDFWKEDFSKLLSYPFPQQLIF